MTLRIILEGRIKELSTRIQDSKIRGFRERFIRDLIQLNKAILEKISASRDNKSNARMRGGLPKN